MQILYDLCLDAIFVDPLCDDVLCPNGVGAMEGLIDSVAHVCKICVTLSEF